MKLLFSSDLHGLDTAYLEFAAELKRKDYSLGVLGGERVGLLLEALIPPRLAHLVLERAQLLVEFLEDVIEAQQILFGGLDLALGLLALPPDLVQFALLLVHVQAHAGADTGAYRGGPQYLVELAITHEKPRQGADTGSDGRVSLGV